MNYSLPFIRTAKRMAGFGGKGLFLVALLLAVQNASASCNASFTYSVTGTSVTFTNTSTGTTGPTYYSWSFGDGGSANTKNPTHNYSSGGIYPVSLYIRDSSAGCSNYFYDSVYVVICGADFTKSGTYADAYFSANYIGSGGTYYWDFGDGHTTTTYNQYASHTYATGGTYTVCLKISNGSCHDSICKQVVVAGPNHCNAGFTWSVGSNGKVTFTNTSTGLSGGTTNYYWDFGDGSYGTSTNPVHVYNASGFFIVQLFMQDSTSSGSCSDDFTDSVKVTGACNASFTVDNTNGLSVKFYPAGQNFTSYQWSFGDGHTSTETGPMHTYGSAGNYTICLLVHGDSGCVDSFCKSITVSAHGSKYISGYITLEDTTAAPDSGTVYLIYYDPSDSSLTAIDTVPLHSDTSRYATYTFTGLSNGNYLVKAALSKNSAFRKMYFPTYADTSRKWKDARTITVSGSSIYNANIEMQRGKYKGGKGFIGGKVSQGANKKEGDPLEDIEVMLTDAVTKEAVAYTYTDAQGAFSFTDLAFGSYEVYTEVVGLTTAPGSVTLSESNPEVTNVEVKVSSSGVTTGFRNNAVATTIGLTAYPNPVKETLYMDINSPVSMSGHMLVIDMEGKVLYSQHVSLTAGKQKLEISTKQLPAGMYQLLIQNPVGTISQYRFTKLTK